MTSAQILVVDLGGQYTRLIARRLRYLGVRPYVAKPAEMNALLACEKPKGIILSGGAASIYDADMPSIPEGVITAGVPVLGICLGMHWIAQQLGGVVRSVMEQREYGMVDFSLVFDGDPLFAEVVEKSQSIKVLASHGDSVTQLPASAVLTGTTWGPVFASFWVPEQNLWGIQFHPEVDDRYNGLKIFKNFLQICGAQNDWNPEDEIARIQQEVKEAVGDKKAIIAFSGGVDSTFLTRILKPVLGDRLMAVTLNAGNLRKGELEEICAHARAAGAGLLCTAVQDDFLRKLKGLVNAEEKRKAFRGVYAELFHSLLGHYSAEVLIQGSLATDFIESGAQGEAEKIKTHHNVGVESLHPLRHYFKDEIREMARLTGLPPSVTERMPFPGPGLFIRIIGAEVTRERLEIVRWADGTVYEIVARENAVAHISQLIVALLCIPTTGVKGDRGTYANAIVVRGVETLDFMTGRGHQFAPDLRREITAALTKHPDIVRVWYDETDKPPATFELQ